MDAEIISSYTDGEAIEDGVLMSFKVKTSEGIKVIPNHRITANAFNALKEYHGKRYPEYDDVDFLGFFFNEILTLRQYAIDAWENGGILKTDFRFKVGNFNHSKILWFLPNENGGVTVMLPEDY